MAGLEYWELAYLFCVVGAGSFIRGVTGFGSSMIYVVGMTFVIPAAEAVPIILMLELIVTLWLLPPVWHQVHKRSLMLLLLGCAIAIPFGLVLLNYLPRAPMQAVIAIVVLAVCLMLRAGFRLKQQPGAAGTIGIGMIAGVLTGATSAGGPPAVIYYFSGPQAVAVGRASLIAFLGGADLVATGMAAYDGLIFEETILRTALIVPSMLVGSWIGTKVFYRIDADRFRQWVIITLACLSVASLTRAILSMVAAV